MKVYFLRYIIILSILLTILHTNNIAQSKLTETRIYNCEQQPLGIFRQVTNVSVRLSSNYFDTLMVNKEDDIKENRWTLDALDEVDPNYKFYLVRNPSKSENKNCEAEIPVLGSLISPTGKLFNFTQATYDIPSRTLKFITSERDGFKYEVEAQFYAHPKLLKGVYEKGSLKLKAIGKNLGIVQMEFTFVSSNSE